ncbi:MAG: flagellar biosynthetic protein FliO [Proteobacteria bacterium]|nr:flagellar biosynthetic protein FliO [Pseudomonadota bacterium]
MLGETMGDFGGRLLLATSGVGLALIALVAVLRFVRRHNGRLPFGLSVAQSKEKRLQVLDTVAIDARRRLVLIRRDQVEHLILIGGPSDVVIEADIKSTAEVLSLPQPVAPQQPSAVQMPAAQTPTVVPASPRPSVASLPTPRPKPPAQPLERPLPVTPHAAYGETASEFSGPDPDDRSEELRQAEAHLEAMRRRILSNEQPQAERPTTRASETSDFARVLDSEMKTPLYDTPRPLANAEAAPKEPDLQKEIARIFGKAP